MRFSKYTYLFLVICCTTRVLSNSVIMPSRIEDIACINTSAQAAIPIILAGFPELEIKRSDPLYIERIEGNLPGFKYVFFNTTVTGVKNCVVSNIKIDSKLTNLHYEMKCPGLKLEGEYQMSGKLITLPVEGNGHFTVTKANSNKALASSDEGMANALLKPPVFLSNGNLRKCLRLRDSLRTHSSKTWYTSSTLSHVAQLAEAIRSIIYLNLFNGMCPERIENVVIKVFFGNHIVIVDSKLETTESDGKTHLNINKLKLKCEALAPVKYAFENLYNGQKDKGCILYIV